MPETNEEVIKRLEDEIEHYKQRVFNLEDKLKQEQKKRFRLEDYVHATATLIASAQSFIDRGCND